MPSVRTAFDVECNITCCRESASFEGNRWSCRTREYAVLLILCNTWWVSRLDVSFLCKYEGPLDLSFRETFKKDFLLRPECKFWILHYIFRQDILLPLRWWIFVEQFCLRWQALFVHTCVLWVVVIYLHVWATSIDAANPLRIDDVHTAGVILCLCARRWLTKRMWLCAMIVWLCARLWLTKCMAVADTSDVVVYRPWERCGRKKTAYTLLV